MSDNKFSGTSIIPCDRCVFFSFEERGIEKRIGFCRLDPPQVIVGRDGNPKTVLPVVKAERDGCGQGELALDIEKEQAGGWRKPR